MKRRTRKLISFFLSFAMVISLANGTGITVSKASAADATDDKANEAAVTVTGDHGDGEGHIRLQTVTASAIMAADSDISLEEITANNARVYVHVTKASPYSRLKISGGTITPGQVNASNKELIGRKCTTSTNTHYYLHSGYRTTGGYGSGQGVQESGNYVFPDNGMNKGIDADSAGVALRAMTTDVDAYIIGIVFAGGKSVTLDEDGTIHATDFDPSDYDLESMELDDSDYSDEELAEREEEEQKKEEEERQAARSGLAAAIEGCEALDEDYYQADSWSALQEALEVARAAYAIEDSDKTTYRAARDALENVRTAMVPKASTEEGNPKDFRILSKDEVVYEMGAGINLGNTLDGHTGLTPSETSWQAYKTTKEYIKALHDAGYNTVRVPVTWGTMINEDYSINTAWMARVQEIVDYCVEQDMYCIINVHHDGAANHDNRGDNTPMCWLDTAANDIEAVYAKFEGVWKSIAENFKDYDEHLIFESMNEVTDDHSGNRVNEDTQILNNLNQLFVNTVRATGSNNTKRWLAITGRFATFSSGTTMPEDSLVDPSAETTRLMFSVHIYKNNSSVRWTYNQLKDWQSSLSSSYKNVQSLDPNMPIYVGEYGVRTQKQSGSATGYNNAERALNYEFCAAVADFYGAVPIVWDQGSTNYNDIETQTGLFTDWDRPNLKPVYDDVVEATIRGSYLSYSSDLSERISGIYTSYGHASTSNNSVSTDPEITEITDLTLSEDSINLKVGERTTITTEVAPENTNDVVLWSTDDDSVATVSKGMIHAKKAGITTIHAYSQSGSVSKELRVVVSPNGEETAVSVTTDTPYYSLNKGETAIINTTVLPADSKDEITYTSSNTKVASVNSAGIITAAGAGEAYIIVSAASGVSTIVKVHVEDLAANMVDVSLHAYYNNGDEEGEPITITEDGQYTVSFDLSKDLSEAGQKAGITDLNNVVSIYIKDCNASNPTVEEAQIRYDKITVNDTADLTITNTDFKSAIKENGQFDTNDPINGWDGSVVSEVQTDSSSHTVSFTTVENPTKITVTFTIQGLKFFSTGEKVNEATEMTTTDENIIKLAEIGDTADIHLSLAPIDTDSSVTLYSTNASVVALSDSFCDVDEDGNVTVTLTALSEGTATIVAITENGLKVFYSIGVGDVEVSEPEDPTPDGLQGPTETPTETPTGTPPETPTEAPTENPSAAPSTEPTPSGEQPGVVPTAAPDAEPTATPSTDIKNGSVQTVGKATYSVTSTKSKTVEYKSSKNKKATSITVPATVKLKVNGKSVTYKVTSIAKNAFKSNTKLKTVKIGKNVKSVKANAFKSCKNLKKITIQSTVLKTVGKNAIKGISKKAVITCPKKQKKAYKKLFKANTGYKKTMKIK